MNSSHTNGTDAQQTRRAGRWLFTSFLAIILILGIAGGLTLVRRQTDLHALAKETETLSVRTVAVIHPISEASQEDLTLPGTLQAYVESPIYARTTGYLKKWDRDIGSHVKQGDLLAELDTPEVDQDLSQAKASRDQIKANLSLAKSTADRWAALRKTDSVSQQEADEKQSAYEQLNASLQASEASVHRLEDLEAFKRITAPFDGVITKRLVDDGTLVSSGTAQPLFRLAQMDPIRVYVSVPEMYAPAMKPGVPAYLELQQYAGERFGGKVARTSESIDPATRTLLTEVDVPNPQGHLLPGGYAQVHIQVGGGLAIPLLQVPVNALLFRSEGLRAAVVGDDNRVHLRALTIGRDFGTALEVMQGLSKDDWIVVNPPDSLDEGEVVHVERPKPGTTPAGAVK